MEQSQVAKQTMTLPSEREIQIVRWFDAPRALLWRAQTDPALIAEWWGPRYLRTSVDKHDLRVGGQWRYVQVAPDGSTHAFRGEFKEVNPVEKLVYTFEYEAMAGHVILETATLVEQDGGTLLTMHQLFASSEDRDGMIASGMEEGQIESWDRLAELLSAQAAEIVIVRDVAAPRARVWQAFAHADQLAKWWGPKGLAMEHVALDFRPQGMFLYGMAAANGAPMWGRFIYLEIKPEDLIVWVNSFSDPNGGITRHPSAQDWPLEMLVKLELVEMGETTRLTLRSRPFNASPAEIAVFAANHESMNQGFGGTFAQLDEFLALG